VDPNKRVSSWLVHTPGLGFGHPGVELEVRRLIDGLLTAIVLLFHVKCICLLRKLPLHCHIYSYVEGIGGLGGCILAQLNRANDEIGFHISYLTLNNNNMERL
jgi:hypothetical protein